MGLDGCIDKGIDGMVEREVEVGNYLLAGFAAVGAGDGDVVERMGDDVFVFGVKDAAAMLVDGEALRDACHRGGGDDDCVRPS